MEKNKIKTPIVPVILAGGSGTRLWPLSTESYPKQFLSLLGEKSLLELTLDRVHKLKGTLEPILVCNKNHKSVIAEQLQQIDITPLAVLLEPVGRNTAPAITAAAMQAMSHAKDPILLVLPSDHLITDSEVFSKAVNTARQYATLDKLVTFGVKPAHPETGYGYIKVGEAVKNGDAYVIAEFIEKPDLRRAKTYLKSGDYYWNSGIFMFRASRFLAEVERYAPDIFVACKDAFAKSSLDDGFVKLDPESFSMCPSNSIDYAIMENTADAVVIPLLAGWSDIGSWKSIWKYGEKDNHKNVVIGNVVAEKTKNSYIRATERKVVVVGVEDLIVVETDSAVLIVKKDMCEDVKKIVDVENSEGKK